MNYTLIRLFLNIVYPYFLILGGTGPLLSHISRTVVWSSSVVLAHSSIWVCVSYHLSGALERSLSLSPHPRPSGPSPLVLRKLRPHGGPHRWVPANNKVLSPLQHELQTSEERRREPSLDFSSQFPHSPSGQVQEKGALPDESSPDCRFLRY